MIVGLTESDTETAQVSVPDRAIYAPVVLGTSRPLVAIGSVSFKLTPGNSSGSQNIRGSVIRQPLGTAEYIEGAGEEVLVSDTDQPGWYTFRLAEPIQGTPSDNWWISLQFDAPAVVEWASDGASDDPDCFYIDGTYGISPDVGAGNDGEVPLPLAIADLVPVPPPPYEEDAYYARLGFDSAQAALGDSGPIPPRRRAVVGWHGTYIDIESQGASFAIANTDSALADLVGQRVKITYGKRSVITYVHRQLDLDTDEDLSLSRRAYQALAPLSTDSLIVRVEALGAAD